nr:NDR1/HIN1-like protein 10 [Tanacetum cinerariifolium]
MSTPHHQIYIQNTPDNCLNLGGVMDSHQVRRHHNAEYNKHHAKENLTTRVSKLLCAVFLGILFIVGIVLFILWLGLHPHRPRFYIHEFSIPSLGLADTNGFSTAQVTLNLTARNLNIEIGIYYDTMNLTLYYKDQTIAETPLLSPFYQFPKNTAIIYGTLSRPTLKIDKARWMQFLAARKCGEVSVKLDAASLIRFKVKTWGSRRHKMHANCEIRVGLNGMLLPSDKGKRCPFYFS